MKPSPTPSSEACGVCDRHLPTRSGPCSDPLCPLLRSPATLSEGPSAKQREVVGEWLMALREMQAKGRDIDWISLAHTIAEAVIANAPTSAVSETAPIDTPLLYEIRHPLNGCFLKERCGAAIDRASVPSARVCIGWIQELADGRKCFYEGELDPREVHDNGKPCYRVFK